MGRTDGTNPRARSERFRSVMAQCGRAVAAVACLAAQAAPALAGPPDPAWVTRIVEEDDFWAPNNKDRHYTHGVRIAFTSPDVHSRFWQAPFDWIGSFTTAFPSQGPSLAGGETVVRRYNIIALGQNMYTPQNPALVNPDPHDRPYAGWLYGGVGRVPDHPRRPARPGERCAALQITPRTAAPRPLAHAPHTPYTPPV